MKNKANIGIIGTGAVSGVYTENIINRFDNLNLAVIASKNFLHAKAAAEKYGVKAETVDEMMNDNDIDIVVNLTPVKAHAEIIGKAIDSGKNIYTEKTMTDSFELSRKLCADAEKRGISLCSAPDTFLGSALMTAKKAIEDGLIGNVQSFAIAVSRDGNMLLSTFPFLREKGGDVVNDYAVYYITALVNLLGGVSRVGGVVRKPFATHTGVNRSNADYGREFNTPNESQASAIIIMKSGVTGTFHINSDSAWMENPLFAIYGTKGILYLPDSNNFGGEVVYVTAKNGEWGNEKPVTLTPVNSLDFNARGIGVSEMADAIENGRKPLTDGRKALHVQEVLSRILSCGDSGRFVNINTEIE